MVTDGALYVVWSNHKRGWYGPNPRHIVPCIEMAGRFALERAIRIVGDAITGEHGDGVPVLQVRYERNPTTGARVPTTDAHLLLAPELVHPNNTVQVPQ